jgi:flagellin-like protein
MSLCNIVKSSKAISPILATLLLIVITVSGITVTYAWISSYTENTTHQAGIMLYNANVAFTTDKISIDIGNSGTSDTNIIALYIGTSESNQQNYLTSPVALKEGQIINLNLNYPWVEHTTYFFKVVPDAGLQALTFQAKSQQDSTQINMNWWSTLYGYRQAINITNNAAQQLPAGYSIKANIDPTTLIASGKLKADYSDLRVTYLQGTSWTEIDRDIISTENGNIEVWFKTQIPIDQSPSTDNSYYIYYGNPSAQNPPENKSNVYLWFDNFNRPNNADVTTESAYKQTNGGAWEIENNMLKNTGAAGDPNKLLVETLGIINFGVELSTKIQITNWVGDSDLGRMGLTCNVDKQNGEGYCGLFHFNNNRVAFLNDLRSWGSSATYSWTTGIMYNMQFKVTNTSSVEGSLRIWQDGTNMPSSWTLQGNFGSSARDSGELGLAGSRQADITYFDDFKARYAAQNEPTVTLNGQESS